MTIFDAIIVGFVQGLTEFLPVSSDGHLVVVDQLLALPQGHDGLGFDILLHAGSLLAILIAYRATWIQLLVGLFKGEKTSLRIIGLILVATVPGVIAGLLLEDTVTSLRSYTAAGVGFLITGAVLIVGEEIGKRRVLRNDDIASIGVSQALLIGIAQAIAILPGVSRSGLTISTGRALGLPRARALDFSFLMAAPIIAGAVSKTLFDAWQGAVIFPPPEVSVAGFITSFLISMLAIALLKLLVLRRSLAVFSGYLFILGIILLVADRL